MEALYELAGSCSCMYFCLKIAYGYLKVRALSLSFIGLLIYLHSINYLQIKLIFITYKDLIDACGIIELQMLGTCL